MELGQPFYIHEDRDSEADTVMLSNQPQTPDSVICRKVKLYLWKPLQPNAFLTNRVVTENGIQRGDMASQGHTVRPQAELGLEWDSAFDAEHLLGPCPASHGPGNCASVSHGVAWSWPWGDRHQGRDVIPDLVKLRCPQSGCLRMWWKERKPWSQTSPWPCGFEQPPSPHVPFRRTALAVPRASALLP